MKKMFFMAFFVVLIAGCDDNNWKPDYIAFANVKKIQLSGLTGKPDIEFNIGYWETNNYNTKQMFKKYTLDGTDHFLPGIDISYIAFEKYYNPPKYDYKTTFLANGDNVLIVEISCFGEGE
jgi:hypothetical protein